MLLLLSLTGINVNRRHYYQLIQKNMTLVNDAKRFRACLEGKLQSIDDRIAQLTSCKEDNKIVFFRRFYSFRKHYFTGLNMFPCGSNSDKPKIDSMCAIPNHVPLAKRWNISQMEKLKKVVGE